MYTTSTPRRGSQVLLLRASLSHAHNVGPDSAAMPCHPTPHGGRLPQAARHHASSCRWQPAWLRGLGGGLGRPIAWGPHETAAEEIEARPAKHLALEHFEAIDVPFDRTGRPGQGHPCFDRLVVLIQPLRKALQGLQRAGGRALEPGVKRLRLPLTDQGGKILRKVNRLGHLSLLRAQLRELLRLGLGALRLASEHEPRRPARRQGRARRCPGGRPWARRKRRAYAATTP